MSSTRECSSIRGPADHAEARGSAAHPRHDRAVVGADRDLHAHASATAQASHEAHEVGPVHEWRHAVHDHDGAVNSLLGRLEHERLAAVSPGRSLDLAVGPQEPSAVPLVAEERGEAGG
jgi:hypothetical protein